MIKLLSVYNFDLSMSDLLHGSLPEVRNRHKVRSLHSIL